MKLRPGAVALVCTLVQLPAPAAHAITTYVGGSLSCPSGQSVWLRGYTDDGEKQLIEFFAPQTTRIYATTYFVASVNTGRRSTSWKIRVAAGIDSAMSGAFCGVAGAVRTAP